MYIKLVACHSVRGDTPSELEKSRSWYVDAAKRAAEELRGRLVGYDVMEPDMQFIAVVDIPPRSRKYIRHVLSSLWDFSVMSGLYDPDLYLRLLLPDDDTDKIGGDEEPGAFIACKSMSRRAIAKAIAPWWEFYVVHQPRPDM